MTRTTFILDTVTKILTNRYKRIAESKLTALIYNALNKALFDFSCWSTD